ncbi:hypothetical protein A6U91_07500 [Agrobacterium tumefaciens]|uniref:Uncharacterized protein n=1 Tax=Agrobacterium tumefaciens TaxID=358 RepID=A0AB36EIU8_AGRTU|nr:hypothetical protein A6U91_07500 [Agrobacterium tumefaciens]
MQMVYLSQYVDARNSRLRDKHKPRQIVKGERRKHVILQVMEILDDFRFSAWENEGSTRAGLRSALCIAGHDWTASDVESAALITAAFQKLAKGARPSWAEGQPEYTAPIEACNFCKGPLAQFQIDRRERFCGVACATAALKYRSYGTQPFKDSLGRAAYRILYQAKTKPRECIQCQASYQPIREGSDQMFCTRRCRNISMTTLPVKPCLHCGTEFKPHKPTNQHCSMRCGAAHRYQTARIEKQCVCCGMPFVAKISKAMYCSVDCKKHALKVRRKTAAVIALPQPLTVAVFDGWFRRAA